jgi:hypothetical protein
MDFDATVSGAGSNSYLTVEEADSLIDAYKNDDLWDALDDDEKERILMRLTRRIDSYRPWGVKDEEGQALCFPRTCDGGLLPSALKAALMETVDAELSGEREQLKAMQSEGVTSANLVGQSLTFGSDPSELPAAARRLLDKLFAAGSSAVISNRPLVEQDPEAPSSFFGG